MSEAQTIAIELLQARCSELEEERDWLARQYQKHTGAVYVPGKVRGWQNEAHNEKNGEP